MRHHTLFFRKLRKILQNLSSAEVVIGALRELTNSQEAADLCVCHLLWQYNKSQCGGMMKRSVFNSTTREGIKTNYSASHCCINSIPWSSNLVKEAICRQFKTF